MFQMLQNPPAHITKMVDAHHSGLFSLTYMCSRSTLRPRLELPLHWIVINTDVHICPRTTRKAFHTWQLSNTTWHQRTCKAAPRRPFTTRDVSDPLVQLDAGSRPWTCLASDIKTNDAIRLNAF